MWEGSGGLYWLWDGQLAEGLFMSMRGGTGSIGVGGV